MVKSDRNGSECALISRRMDGACHEGDDSHAARRIRARGLTCCSHPPAHQPRRSKSLHSTDGLHSNVAAFCWTSWIHSEVFSQPNLFSFFLVSVFLSNAVIIPLIGTQEVSQMERSHCKNWTSRRTFPDNEKIK